MTNVLPALIFRTATEADVDAVVTLVQSAYRGESGRSGWTTESDLLDGQRTDAGLVGELLADPAGEVRLCFADGRLVACCQLERRGDIAYFGMFAVRPDAQGGGIGKAVLADAERRAREAWAAKAMEMAVIAQRAELIAWYERRGYHRTGRRAPFPYGDERFGVPLRDDLIFDHLIKAL